MRVLLDLCDGGPQLGLLALGLAYLAAFADGDWLGRLAEEELNVARGRFVSVNSSVGPVGPPATVHGAVDLNVRDDEALCVKGLHLGVALRVLE
mmetsp:Transcript_12424/g.30508  ORF Transcript_12424/g.30508 Transcript_12424/m.30508 type:complete len:94 (+) Transcript_12424:123-404(+)